MQTSSKTNLNEINEQEIDWLLQIVSLLLIGLILTHSPNDADMWWHLRAGQVMWQQKIILLQDSFSYTRYGAPWINAFWLSDILLYLLYDKGGYLALASCVALLGALTFHIVSKSLKEYPFVNSFLLVLAAITAAPVWGPRPQIISFLFVAALDFWLLRSPHRQWLLIPFFALWANLHGGWFWGFLLLAAHIAGLFVQSFFQPEEQTPLRRQALSLLGWSALSALAIGLNPNGLSLWRLPFQQVDVSLQIQEWLSPDFHRLDFHPLLWMAFLLLLTAPYAKRPLPWPQLFKALGFLYLTFVTQRAIALFAITATPLLSEWIQASIKTLPRRESRARQILNPRLTVLLNATLIAALSLGVLGNLYLISRPARVEENYPLAAVEWVQTNRPSGRMFNSYNWGGYLLWRLPDYPVFIDGRADLYGSKLIQQWHNVVNANENAQAILAEWDVEWVFLEPGWPAATLLKNNDWHVLYEDDRAVVLGRP